ncbi:MAG: phosphate ABC transporter ATP-binding protein PstB [Nitrospirota bacterium]
MSENNITFSIEKLNVWYGEKHILKDNTTLLQKQQITAMIGPSGCGKSTFIRCLNRMNDFIPNFRHTGAVLFENQDIYRADMNPIEVRLRIGMVFQKPNPFPKSIYDNITYGPRLCGIRKENELDEIVERSLIAAALWAEVKDNLHHSALALSGGQQQRLCIARALAVEPEVLLLDEPCSALDPIATAKIEELLIEIKKTHTVVMVTHNMQQAARVSDQTGFFLMGELIEFGKTSTIFTNPRDQRTEDYITGRYG